MLHLLGRVTTIIAIVTVIQFGLNKTHATELSFNEQCKIDPEHSNFCGNKSRYDVALRTTKINYSIKPQGLPEVFTDCMNQSTCRDILKEVGKSYGIPEIAVDIGSIATGIIAANRTGEVHEWSINAIPGHSVCNVWVTHQGVVNDTGPRTTSFHINARRKGIYVYSWANKNPIFKGRTGYDGYLVVEYMKDTVYGEKARSRCDISVNPTCHTCRGSTQNDQGFPICYGTEKLNRTLHRVYQTLPHADCSVR